ncbi:MAG TPA: hypothetical protein VJ955_06035 [Desulfuromonadales bacterium]|nr:hypothetical protein [Desulfuromonadales bacterium]
MLAHMGRFRPRVRLPFSGRHYLASKGLPTLMIAPKNRAGLPQSELKKIIVTLAAIAAMPKTG